MSTPAIEHTIQLCVQALSHSPAVIFSDFDGTLSPVAPTPSQAFLAPGAEKSIIALNELLDGFVIITGRGADDARERIGIAGLDIIGNHGLEHIVDGIWRAHPGAQEQIAAIESAVYAIKVAVDKLPYARTIVIENKRLSASVHYRLAPDPDEALIALRPVVSEQAELHELVATDGKLVIELRPLLQVNKGTAVQSVIRDRGLAGAIMLGDDVTDVDAFLAIRQGRESGLAGVAVAVISPETHHSVIETADALVNGVEDVVQLLDSVVSELTRSASSTR